jgi:hypothetical protein
MALDSPIVAILPQDSGQLLVSRITGHVESQIGTCPVSALSGTSGHDSRTYKILESSREYLRLDEGDSVEPYIVVIVVVATLLVLGWFGSRRAIRREKAIALRGLPIRWRLLLGRSGRKCGLLRVPCMLNSKTTLAPDTFRSESLTMSRKCSGLTQLMWTKD